MNNKKIEQISLKIFGTKDYQTMLEILPPYDGLVRMFQQQIENLKQEEV